jgi:putative Ca2+/H+ antiporter (TMEM165/GDT1 family)
MESFLISTGVVALAEMGDKTQLLAFLLASRFKKPLPIIAGILVATILNHALAGALGSWLTQFLSPEMLRWILGIAFLAMAIWTLIPDKLDEEDTGIHKAFGVFSATLTTFFLAEMGDKTQVATVIMAAEFSSVILVIAGTTLGMLIADVPAVFLGKKFADKVPLKWIHAIAAAIFALLAILILTDFTSAVGL